MSNCITMSVESKPKVGRPTLQEEVAIKSQLKFYFENGVGVEATASTTGRSTATVSKYFRIWSDELKEAMVKDFIVLKNSKLGRVNICDNIDLQIRDYILVVPTIIFFENGKEYKRLEADFFELKTTKEELQKIIDDKLGE